jgi:hypothetical protein
METPPADNRICMLVLVPHRNCLSALGNYSARLFAAGFDGAHSFPRVSPLAVLSRPLEDLQLKTLASRLRDALGNAKLCGPPAVSAAVPAAPGGQDTPDPPGPPDFRLYGPALPLPRMPIPGLLCRWEPPVLAAALLAPGDEEIAAALERSVPGEPDGSVEGGIAGETAFRAAALANLSLAALDTGEPGYSFQWEIGRLFWLPKPKGRGNTAL